MVDLLSIVQTWLIVLEDSQLTLPQLSHIITLIDPSQVTTTIRAVECIGLALAKPNQFGPKEIFNLIKMLYRCLLFIQPSDTSKALDLIFNTLMKVISTYSEETLASIQELQNSIGYWVGCLTYDLKNAEIDVFLHNVNGPNSTVQNNKELLCGEELRFLDETTKHNAFIDRKCLAARFLSPLIDVLYRSNVQIQDQQLSLSLQLHFIPYLRSNSLYQRMGIALAVNCWARMFRRAFNAQKPQQYPTLIISELERILIEAPQRLPYDEPTTMIKSLTSECNEFRRHCLQKGVPQTDCPSLDGTDIDAAIERMYMLCKERLKKQQDFEALEGRRTYLKALISQTRLQITTNNNRLNALCASALFYFGHQPPQMTPQIRPLMDAITTEDNEFITEEVFYDSFPILFSITLQRQPCPHPKILKNLANALMECQKFVPKRNAENLPEVFFLSNPPLTPLETKSKNSQLILRKYGEQLGQVAFQICPVLAEYLVLNQGFESEEAIEVRKI